MAQYDDVPVQRITVVSIVSILVTIVTILAVQVIYFGMQTRANVEKTAMGKYVDSDKVLSQQRDSINRSGVDPDNARLVIPIEQAMRDVIRKSGENHEQQSGSREEI